MDSNDNFERPPNTKLLLYSSHFVAMWGQRTWQFAIVIFLTLVFPNSLRYVSVLGFTQSLTLMCLSPLVGEWADDTPRLKAIRIVLAFQEGLNFLSALCALALVTGSGGQTGLVGLIVICSSLAELASSASTIVIEKDWVVVLSTKDSAWLSHTNSSMRRIDLFCLLAAPTLSGAIISASSASVAAMLMAVWSLVAVAIEYYSMHQIYQNFPPLSNPRGTPPSLSPQPTDSVSTEAPQPNSEKDTRSLLASDTPPSRDDGVEPTPNTGEDSNLDPEQQQQQQATEDGAAPPSTQSRWSFENLSAQAAQLPRPVQLCLGPLLAVVRSGGVYQNQRVFPAALALALLYMTVLSLGEVQTAYMVSRHWSPIAMGGLRGFGAVLALFGSFSFPVFARNYGLVATGSIGGLQQWFMILFAVLSLYISSNSTSLIVLGLTTAFSRIGLWIFDLSVNQLIQEYVPEHQRGAVNGVQQSLQSMFGLIAFLCSILLSHVDQFWVSAALSFLAVSASVTMYSLFASREAAKKFALFLRSTRKARRPSNALGS
eukprot:c12500_g1_i1.p1 GENE.c12500_g1_i1~~c12500_g1_i1.p1  ORF type:complete len:542 (+),score=101.95 c12500_g1_i1:41-1666(+)